jgi:hypothetical protein
MFRETTAKAERETWRQMKSSSLLQSATTAGRR